MSSCDKCPTRATCRAICDAVESQLPKEWSGRDSIFGMPDAPERVARLMAQRNEVMFMLDHRDLLTKAQREVFDLYYNDGLSHAQIAKQLGVRRNTVTEHMLRARERIMRKVDQMEAKREAQ